MSNMYLTLVSDATKDYASNVANQFKVNPVNVTGTNIQKHMDKHYLSVLLKPWVASQVVFMETHRLLWL